MVRLSETVPRVRVPVEGGTGNSGSGTFVASQKISKIRWRPRVDSSTLASPYFVTGSWDDGPDNSICLWKTGGKELDEDGSVLFGDNGPKEPQIIHRQNHSGNVHALEFLNSEVFITGSSNGSVQLFKIFRDNNSKYKIGLQTTWPNLHSSLKRNSASKDLSCNGDVFVTVGEDGTANLLSSRHRQPIKTFKNADSCSLTAVQFVKHDEIVTANMRGQMKLWDIRITEQKPSASFNLSATDQVGITCISRHPTQPHVLCTGSQDGMLAIWDFRNEKFPVTLLEGHGGEVSEVQFHHQQPDHIFSCSQNGDIWHWDSSAVTRSNILNYGSNQRNDLMDTGSTSPWLSSEAVKHKVEISSLMTKQYLPINSLDALGSSIILGGDNEAIFLFSSIIL